MPNWWLDSKVEREAKAQEQKLARSERAARRREAAAWSGFEEEDNSFPVQNQEPASKAAATPVKTPLEQRSNLRVVHSQPVSAISPVRYSDIAELYPPMDGYIGSDESAAVGRRGGLGIDSPLLKSSLMPTLMKYPRGMYQQPIYSGEEGIKAVVYACDLQRAINLWFQQDPKSEQAKELITRCNELMRALREAFSTHPAGKEWFESECLPTLEAMLDEVPLVSDRLALNTVSLAAEYKATALASGDHR
jgi:hypothetical protein